MADELATGLHAAKLAHHRAMHLTGQPPALYMLDNHWWQRFKAVLFIKRHALWAEAEQAQRLYGVAVQLRVRLAGPALRWPDFAWRDCHGDSHVVLDERGRIWTPPELPPQVTG